MSMAMFNSYVKLPEGNIADDGVIMVTFMGQVHGIMMGISSGNDYCNSLLWNMAQRIEVDDSPLKVTQHSY